MINRILAYSIILIVFSSCERQELPEPAVSSPVFHASMNIDGEEFNLVPGVDGMYMYTDQELLGNGGATLSSGIAPENCPECGPALWIDWNYSPNGMGEEFNPDLHFVDGFYPIQELDGPLLQYFELFNFEFPEGNELFLNGMPIQEDEGLIMPGSPAEPIVFDFTLFDTNEGFLQGFLNINRALIPSDCDADEVLISSIGINAIDPLTIELLPPPGSLENEVIQWLVDGNTYVTQNGEPLIVGLENPLLDLQVTAIIDDGEGIPEWECSINAFVLNMPSEIESFQLNFEAIQPPSAMQSGVKLIYMNAEGELYSTYQCNAISPQPEESYFEITQIEDFQNNPMGIHTQIATINSEVLLFSEDDPNSEPVVLSISDAEIGFAVGN